MSGLQHTDEHTVEEHGAALVVTAPKGGAWKGSLSIHFPREGDLSRMTWLTPAERMHEHHVTVEVRRSAWQAAHALAKFLDLTAKLTLAEEHSARHGSARPTIQVRCEGEARMSMEFYDIGDAVKFMGVLP